ncbi:Putrescine transport ATP-binding protein PotA [Mucinivorans hirudinis]|uniref:Spermidine/putrescine import ATP-binding protein PotA n=1 Tax=Mucinivorans hirudinis TaxID=1433126 RepID=A0A060RDW5_9BACT|nr:Putrescine transport ATP-binding protein PotA [Mucinivorans hirudinis]
MSNNSIISVCGVTKRFGDNLILDNVSLKIDRGEFVTILGPSGCGKTTLLRIIAGFLDVNQGEVKLEGKDLLSIPPHKRPVNTVFQKYALFPHLNVYDNIAFGLKIKRVDGDTIDREVARVLKMTGLSDYEHRDIDSLSGGQQQRVAIARAIVNKPKVLLLDEPLAALDLKMRKDMQMELKQMHRDLGITFIYVTHDQEEALTLSDTIVVMNNGVIQQIGSPTDIYNEPVNSFVADFIGESNIFNGVMLCDKRVKFIDLEFDCVDEGFGDNVLVDVVLRPEDIYIFPANKSAMFSGKVISSIFKGVHNEMVVKTENGFEVVVQDYNHFGVGEEVGLLIKPNDIHVMRKERVCNTFEATVIDETHVEFLGVQFECLSTDGFERGEQILVDVDFDKVEMLDDLDAGLINANVTFILYKGDHYHLTLVTDDKESIWLDTNDVYDDGDMVGIAIAKENIKLKRR